MIIHLLGDHTPQLCLAFGSKYTFCSQYNIFLGHKNVCPVQVDEDQNLAIFIKSCRSVSHLGFAFPTQTEG